MAELKPLLDEYGIIYDALKKLPDTKLKVEFLEALAEEITVWKHPKIHTHVRMDIEFDRFWEPLLPHIRTDMPDFEEKLATAKAKIKKPADIPDANSSKIRYTMGAVSGSGSRFTPVAVPSLR